LYLKGVEALDRLENMQVEEMINNIELIDEN